LAPEKLKFYLSPRDELDFKIPSGQLLHGCNFIEETFMRFLLGLIFVLPFSAHASLLCSEGHGLSIEILDQEARVSRSSFTGEDLVATFSNVSFKEYTDTLVPTKSYGAVSLDKGDMFHLTIADPDLSGSYSGVLNTLIAGEVFKVELNCLFK
jgi:hypothetical protein